MNIAINFDKDEMNAIKKFSKNALDTKIETNFKAYEQKNKDIIFRASQDDEKNLEVIVVMGCARFIKFIEWYGDIFSACMNFFTSVITLAKTIFTPYMKSAEEIFADINNEDIETYIDGKLVEKEEKKEENKYYNPDDFEFLI